MNRHILALVAFFAVPLTLSACGARASQALTPASASYTVAELSVLDAFSLRSRTASARRFIQTLSPDGNRYLLAIHETTGDREKWCIYTLDGVTPAEEETCLYPDEFGVGVTYVDWSTMAWSPDGRRVAFTEVRAYESDLWVWDIASGKLSNLTDDGVADFVHPLTEAGSETFAMDVHPAWAADGKHLFFARSWYRNGAWEGTTIVRITATGGQPEEWLTISEAPLALRGLRRFGADDRLLFLVSERLPQSSNSGLWVVGDEHSAPQRLVQTGDEEWLQLLQVSPAGERVLILDGQYLDFRVVELSSGETRSFRREGLFVRNATLSPDGGKILYIKEGQAGENELWVRDLQSGEENRLYTGTATSPLVWASNDVILVGNDLLSVGGER